MDFDTLIKPYNEGGLRTLSAQIKWLLKNGLPQSSIDYAISIVYKRMECGETFKDGNQLDQELRKVAREHYDTDLDSQLKKRIAEVESGLDLEWNKLSKWKKVWEVLRDRA